MPTIDLVCEQIKQTLGALRKDEALFYERIVELKNVGFTLVNAGQVSDGDADYRWEVSDRETGEVLASGGESDPLSAAWQEHWYNVEQVHDEVPIEELRVVDGLRDHESFAQAINDWVIDDEEGACHLLVSMDQWEDRFMPC